MNTKNIFQKIYSMVFQKGEMYIHPEKKKNVNSHITYSEHWKIVLVTFKFLYSLNN